MNSLLHVPAGERGRADDCGHTTGTRAPDNLDSTWFFVSTPETTGGAEQKESDEASFLLLEGVASGDDHTSSPSFVAFSQDVPAGDNDNDNGDGAQSGNNTPQSGSVFCGRLSPLLEVLGKTRKNAEDDDNNNNNNNSDVSDILFSVNKNVAFENVVLRSQLAEAGGKAAHYMFLYERKKEELQNVHQTMSTILHGDRNDTLNVCLNLRGLNSQRRQGKDREAGSVQSTAAGCVLGQLVPKRTGAELPVPVTQFLQHIFFGEQDNSACAQDLNENNTTVEWEINFLIAKQHARKGEFLLAMEPLLMAITSTGFDAWQSLLVDDSEWNFLSGNDRCSWDCAVMTTVTGLLKKRNVHTDTHTAAAAGVDNQYGASCPAEEIEGESNDEGSLGLDTLVSFVRRMGVAYAGGSEQRGIAALEELLAASLSAFSASTALLYSASCVRAQQGRKEESLKLMEKLLDLDPSYLLCKTSIHPQ